MEQNEIEALLEKYWQAETSLDEERFLAEYFRQAEVARELEPVREMFAWRVEEAEIGTGADFDRRMLGRIAEMEEERKGRATGGIGGDGVAKRIGISFRVAAAAAIILCLGIGLLIPATSPAPKDIRVSAAVIDTYTDPQQALAAVRKALLVASARMNEGEHITQKNITRLHDTWQTAIGD